MKVIVNLKNGNAARVGEVMADILKYEKETVIEWIYKICEAACEEGWIPGDKGNH